MTVGLPLNQAIKELIMDHLKDNEPITPKNSNSTHEPINNESKTMKDNDLTSHDAKEAKEAENPSNTHDNEVSRKRRNILKGVAAAGGVAAFATGYTGYFKDLGKGLVTGTSHMPTDDRITGNALPVEGKVVNGAFQQTRGQVVSNTQCFGCWTQCSLRLRVDTEQNRVLRIMGNPYHPLSHEEHFDYETPISEAWARLGGENGLNERSTACARGASMAEGLTTGYRVLHPMKRVGKRGEGQWKRISFEQLIEEIVEGGDLFGEGHVDGLRAIRDLETPINPDFPEYGVKANQLFVTTAGNEGRQHLIQQRFAFKGFGTRNFSQHGSYCGLAYRVGSGALLNNLDSNSHGKPDFDHVEFAIFMGHSPAQSGNPFKRQGRQLGAARTKPADEFSYAVVSPHLPLTNTMATRNNRWVSILPGTDSAMAMAMIRAIIDNQWYNEKYLKAPGKAGMEHNQEVSCSNATHLVITSEDHPLYGQFLRESDLNESEAPREESAILVIDEENNELGSEDTVKNGVLTAARSVTLTSGDTVTVKTSFLLLVESAHQHTLEDYSQFCGVPVETMVSLAKKFTSFGRKAAIITHGGMMSGNGFYNAWSIMALNVLIGNMNHKGGMIVNAGKYKEFANGPRYNMNDFKGQVAPKGIFISRAKRPYESSTEYKNRLEKGENPYPAQRPWFPFSGNQMAEMLVSAFNSDPYPFKAWISHITNPVYGIAGFRQLLIDQLTDPKVLPLFIAVDAFINETSAFADYLIPDTHSFESWGFTAPWAGVPVKTTTARWPVVEPRVEKLANGDPICLETFLIAVGKKMDLPGFGDEAIQDANNPDKHYPFNHPEDYFLRAAANVAFDDSDGSPVPDATREELDLTGVSRIKEPLERVLKPEEQMKVAYVYARGGRMANMDTTWKKTPWGDEVLQNGWPRTMQLWNENIGRHRYAMSGERYSGTPSYYPPRFSDGSSMREHYPEKEWPFLLMSFKSHLVSSTSGSNIRLRMIQPTNLVGINPLDAEKLQLKNGDEVYIESPSGKQKVQIMLLDGVKPGVLAVEHGYGHRDMGARVHYVDGEPLYHNKAVGNGYNLNDTGVQDPTRKEVAIPWLDWATGAVVRQGLPAKIYSA